MSFSRAKFLQEFPAVIPTFLGSSCAGFYAAQSGK